MAIFLSKRELEQTEPAEKAAFHSPVPTQMISNGEFNPLPQTRQTGLLHLDPVRARRHSIDLERTLVIGQRGRYPSVRTNSLNNPVPHG